MPTPRLLHLLPSLLPLVMLGCDTTYAWHGDLTPPDLSMDEATPNGGTDETGEAPVDTGDAEAPDFSHLPVFVITTEAKVPLGRQVGGTLAVIEDHDGTLSDLAAAPRAFTGAIGIALEQSGSGPQDKKSYALACRDAAGGDTDCALAGLPAATDWVLYAPLADKTYMRNALAFDLARTIAMPAGRWEPRTAFVEVVRDGTYDGVYLLIERVTAEADRLDLSETVDAETGAADGGFIVKVDGQRGPGFTTEAGTPVDYSWPDADGVPEASAYVAGWFEGFEAALLGPNFADRAFGYAAWIDVDAWVDTFLLNELSGNVDAYRLSAYLWADGPPGVGKLRAGPIWDVDRGFGNADYCNGYSPVGWIADNLATCAHTAEIPVWWARLREDPAFEQRVRGRWSLLRDGALSDEALSQRVTTMQARTAEAEVRDHARWPVVGTRVYPNAYVGASWADEVAWFQKWTLDRAAWMDGALSD